MHRFAIGLLVYFALLVFSPSNVIAQFESEQANRLKAALIYKFSKFVNWPDRIQPSPLFLCTLGNDQLVGVFNNIQANDTLSSTIPPQQVIVQEVEAQTTINTCHILYIAESEHGTYRSLNAISNHYPTLTVSELPGFMQAGGIIEFTYESNRIRFDINLDAAHSANLEISSSLLKLARKIKWNNRKRRTNWPSLLF